MITSPDFNKLQILTHFYNELEDQRIVYLSCQRIKQRIELSEELQASIEGLLKLFSDDEYILILNQYILNPISKIDYSYKNVIDEAKRINHEGVLLLGIEDEIDNEILKKKRNIAALKYHPDKEGDLNKMQIINDAYTQIKELLRLVNEETDKRERCQSGYEYVLKVIILLMSIYNLTYSYDFALEMYKEFKEFELKLGDTSLELRIQLQDVLFELIRGLTKFADNSIITDLYNEFINRRECIHSKYYNRISHEFMLNKYLNKGMRIVINHEVQANNALRLNIIDKDRYLRICNCVTKKMMQPNAKELLGESELCIKFIVPLPSEKEEFDRLKSLRLEKEHIPYPGYYSVLTTLTDDQKMEYFNFYKEDINFERFMKYYFVRLESYLHSALNFVDQCDIESIVKEISLMLMLAKANAVYYKSQIYYCSKLLEGFKLMMCNNLKENEIRVKIMNILIKPKPQTSIIIFHTLESLLTLQVIKLFTIDTKSMEEIVRSGLSWQDVYMKEQILNRNS